MTKGPGQVDSLRIFKCIPLAGSACICFTPRSNSGPLVQDKQIDLPSILCGVAHSKFRGNDKGLSTRAEGVPE